MKKSKRNFRKIQGLDHDGMVEFLLKVVESKGDCFSDFVCKKCTKKEGECSEDSCPYVDEEEIIKEFLSSFEGGEIL